VPAKNVGEAAERLLAKIKESYFADLPDEEGAAVT
jgi:hypothetical protein